MTPGLIAPDERAASAAPATRDDGTGPADAAQRLGLRDKAAHANLHYADSAKAVAANGETMRRPRNIVEWLERFPPISDWKLTDIEIDGAGEVAYVRGSYSMLLSSRAKLPFDSGKYLGVLRKQTDGGWKVIRHIFSSEVASRSRAKWIAAAQETV